MKPLNVMLAAGCVMSSLLLLQQLEQRLADLQSELRARTPDPQK